MGIICTLNTDGDWPGKLHSFSLLPVKVGAADDVQIILHAIDDCVICPGNEYVTFAPLMDAHNGILTDASGMYR